MQFPKRAESEPEKIARHCEAGGLTDEAISYYQYAATLATKRYENSEAVAYLNRGFHLVGMLREGADRDERELELLVLLGAPLIA